MYLFFAIIVAAVASLFSPGDIGDVPFSELTLRMVSKALVTILGYGYAIYLAGKSLDKDRIWPWRWTWPYFGNLLIRAAVIGLVIFGGILVLDNRQADGLVFFVIVGGALIAILYLMFSNELEVFSEKGERDEPKG
jgi:hypothetical protein